MQFAAQGSSGIHAECVSNHYRGERPLRTDQLAALEGLGWSSPTGTPEEVLEKRTGSPNFFRDFDQPVPFGEVARLAVRSLSEVLEIREPGSLRYKAFQRGGNDILLPTLGLRRERPKPAPEIPKADTIEALRGMVLEQVRKASGNRDVEPSPEGDLRMRSGSALVIVRVLDKPPFLRVFSEVLRNVEVTVELLERVNALNAEVRVARLFELDGTVIAAAEMFLSFFDPPKVAEMYLGVCRVAHDFGPRLQKEFGGRLAFEEEEEGPVQ